MRNQKYIWNLTLPDGHGAFLQSILESWKRTPYMAGQKVKRQGADCVQFVTAALDEAFGIDTEVPQLAFDSAIHRPAASLPTVSAMRRAWHGSDDITDQHTIEPGDVLVTRAIEQSQSPRNQGHVMIVSNVPYIAWHAIETTGVAPVHIHYAKRIIHVYRPKRKELWQPR